MYGVSQGCNKTLFFIFSERYAIHTEWQPKIPIYQYVLSPHDGVPVHSFSRIAN